MSKFTKLHEAIKELDGAGTVFVPGDVEAEYLMSREADWPEWEEVQEEMLSNYYWNRGIQDRLTEIGFEIISDMIREVMRERSK